MRTKLILTTLLFLSLGCNKQPSTIPAPPETPQKGALLKAVIASNKEEVLQLLQKGADPNENLGTEGKAITPLMAALALRNEAIAEILVHSGASPYVTYDGYNAQDFSLYILGEDSPLSHTLLQSQGPKRSQP